jgi:HAD superfamily hydrolase (TIGR01662 family)
VVIDAVLFDRDATLIVDVPYNGDPDAVRPMPGAAAAVRRLRARGLRLGVVSNQSGLARGRITADQMAAVRARVEQLLGPFETWQVCPHDETAGCDCRKPRPGLVLAAAAALGVAPERCVVVGDIGSDIAAAQAAGATGILVPTPQTRPDEVAAAPIVLPDLAAAADWILSGQMAPAPASPGPRSVGSEATRVTRKGEASQAPGPARAERAPRSTERAQRSNVLLVRSDALGDVLLTGPAVRAVAARASRVTLLCGPRGRAAAELLPGVDEVIEWTAPWIEPSPAGVDADDVAALVKRIEAAEFDQAIVFTSFHQSPLPMALLLRLAGVGSTAAISEDYPGALLDVRHAVPDDIHEVERALSLAEAAGYPRPPGDDGRPRITADLPDVAALTGRDRYVVVHPGTSVPARACPPSLHAGVVEALAARGRRVLVTGDRGDAALTAYVAGASGVDVGGRTDLRGLAAVLAGADCVVVGNTGPAHLAAAVGTPVVSLFAPTVPYERWRPYGVPVVRLGRSDTACRDSRARLCPVFSHPCLSTLEILDVVTAVEQLTCAS